MAQTHGAVIATVRISSSLSSPNAPAGSLSMGGHENLKAGRSKGAEKTHPPSQTLPVSAAEGLGQLPGRRSLSPGFTGTSAIVAEVVLRHPVSRVFDFKTERFRLTLGKIWTNSVCPQSPERRGAWKEYVSWKKTGFGGNPRVP